jgi:hypothetical protein
MLQNCIDMFLPPSGALFVLGVVSVAFNTFNEFISAMLRFPMHALFVSSCIFCFTVRCNGLVVGAVGSPCSPYGKFRADPCIPNIFASKQVDT